MVLDDKTAVPYWTSCRYMLALVGFYNFTIVYMVRINLSVAMVCMVAPRNATTDENSTFEECPILNISSAKQMTTGTFPWDKTLQSTILGSFFYGYIVTQVAGGWMAEKYGGKIIVFFAMLVSCICTVFSPLAAKYEPATIGPYLLMTLRIILGLATGVAFPAMHTLWGKWAPPYERTKLINFCYSGTIMGNVVTLFGSGLLCVYGFAGGWPSIFYVAAIFNFVLLILWWFLVFDSPSQHPRISKAEQIFIEEGIGDKVERDTTWYVPWVAILKSPPVYAIIIANFCNDWGNYTVLTSLPTYMKEVLKFDIKSNGLLSALPYICMFVASVLFSVVADIVREKTRLSTTVVRKIFQSVAFLVPAGFMIATGFMTCIFRELAVAFLTLGVAFTAAGRSGFTCNHVDIAPRYAGLLFGITNTVATVSGMVSPSAVGALTPNGTKEEWQTVFYIWGSVYLFGALMYNILGSGEKQKWAMDDDEELEDRQEKVFIPISKNMKSSRNQYPVEDFQFA